MYALHIAERILITRIGRMKQQNGWEQLDVQRKKENLFVMFLDGTAEFTVESKHYCLHKGDILIIPAGVPHHARTDTFSEYYYVHFTGTLTEVDEPAVPALPQTDTFDLPDVPHDDLFLAPVIACGEHYNRFFRLFTELFEYDFRKTNSGRILLEASFMKLLACLQQITEKPGYPLQLNKMMLYVRRNLTRPIRLSELSAYCGISPSYASRLFKKHLNMTASAFINHEKLCFACELLDNTGLNISEIADYLGFCDAAYFSKLFKKKYGKSPQHYFS